MDIHQWHDWYAWYQVYIDGRIYWLCKVRRVLDNMTYDQDHGWGGYHIWRYSAGGRETFSFEKPWSVIALRILTFVILPIVLALWIHGFSHTGNHHRIQAKQSAIIRRIT